MPNRPTTYRPVAARPRPDSRPSSSTRGYGRGWQKLRASHLDEYPLCLPCQKRGLVVEATQVDHDTPHRGDYELLMDNDNLVSMCASCHSRKTVQQDGGLGRKPTSG